jgi:putative FmdB family regulatory protein
MPFYNFKCSNDSCLHTFEDLVKIDTKEIKCEKCGSISLKINSYKFVSIGLPNGHNAARATKVEKS